MKKLLQILCLCAFFTPYLGAQFSDNFDDGDISTNPSWQGSTDKFIVNSQGELQLNDSEAGESNIFLAADLTVDFTWELDLSLNFNPSNSNGGRIYLFIDNIDPSIANGYYMEIGENLSEDALKFYRLDDGTSVFLDSSAPGSMSTKPAQVSLRIDRVEGQWTIATDYDKGGFPVEEFKFSDDVHEFLNTGFFGISCKYTVSNADEFYFDNVNGTPFVPDTEGPRFVDYEIVPDNGLLVTFDEALDLASLPNLLLEVTPLNQLQSSEITGAQSNQLLLNFVDELQSGPTYTVQVSGLEDENGNVMEDASFTFVRAVAPKRGDLVINEILFDPPVDGSDFVEILNISNKNIELQNLVISNTSKEGNEKIINQSIVLLPDSIVAFTDDMVQTIEDYQPPSNAYIVQQSIPTFNKDEGNVSLFLNDGTMIDSFNYSEDFHVSFLDDVKSVSLERIFPESASVPENFTSGVENTLYATPGYVNKNLRKAINPGDDVFSIETTVFSPNLDGDSDQLIMQINLPSSGYVSTIHIFTPNGQRIKTIQNNLLTSQEDLAVWDGTLDDGGKAPIGHYIVYFQAHNESGSVLKSKKHVKLLDFF